MAEREINIVNLTAKSIYLFDTEGNRIEIKHDGEIKVPAMREDLEVVKTKYGKIQLSFVRYFYNNVVLPEPKPNTIYIVSEIVCRAFPDRDDLFVPFDLVRDDRGRVIGAKALIMNPHYKLPEKKKKEE